MANIDTPVRSNVYFHTAKYNNTTVAIWSDEDYKPVIQAHIDGAWVFVASGPLKSAMIAYVHNSGFADLTLDEWLDKTLGHE